MFNFQKINYNNQVKTKIKLQNGVLCKIWLGNFQNQ